MAASDITVSNVVAYPGQQQVSLRWTLNDPHANGGLERLRLDKVEVYSNSSNNAATALLAADGIRSALIAGLGRGERVYLWLRPRNRSGEYGEQYPASDTAGLEAVETSGDVLLPTDALGSPGASGYWKTPAGLIIQWGFTSAVPNGSRVNFPIPFPNRVFTLIPVTFGSVATLQFYGTQFTALDNAGFSVYGRIINNAGGPVSDAAVTHSYIALGV
jgi:hypothetical protein